MPDPELETPDPPEQQVGQETVDQIASHIEAEDSESLTESLKELSHAETSYVVSRLDEEDRDQLLVLLPVEESAELLEDVIPPQAADLIHGLEPAAAADIVEHMHAAEQADLLHDLDKTEAQQILEAMEPDSAERTRNLMEYEDDSAGGLMEGEFLAFPQSTTVGNLLADLRENQEKYADYEVQYIYVLNEDEELTGVLRLRDLLLARSAKSLNDLMLPNPISVPATADLDMLTDFFDSHNFVGVPVVDAEKKLVGVLQQTEVEHAAQDREKETFLKVSGIIGGEELRSLPLHQRCIRRLSWLGPNIVLNLIAASVIARFEGTLEQVIALAIFLPIVSDMSGCSGNQAVAVSMRELTMGVLKPNEVLRVFWKEFGLGFFNGIVLGLLLGTIAGIWQDNLWLGIVIGSALALNTMVSVVLGGSVPLVLRRFGVDPALASGPLLTTVTDMCGFFLVLSLATALMERIL